jgi:hypothetical protein
MYMQVKIRNATDIRPDNPFLISGIRLDTGFDLPDIRPDTVGILKIAGYPAQLK